MYTEKVLIAIFLILVAPSVSMAFEGGDGSSTDPYEITTCQQLQDIRDNVSANYELVADIDCSSTRTWNSGHGFDPIQPIGRRYIDSEGVSVVSFGGPKFNGSLDGKGHTIEDIYIDNTTVDGVGVIGGMTAPGEIVNLNLDNATVNGSYSVGGVVGHVYGGKTLENLSVSGYIEGRKRVGGVVGRSSVRLKHISSDVKLNVNLSRIGGIAGVSSANISNSHSTGSISGNKAGGIAGAFSGSSLKNSSSNVEINSTFRSGGLIGQAGNNLSIENSYATGNINGNLSGQNTNFGGIIGVAFGQTLVINNSYSTGDVRGNFYTGTYDFQDSKGFGGIVGEFPGFRSGSEAYNLTISNSYSAGNVTGRKSGGLIGINSANNTRATDAYWDVDSSGQTSSLGTSTGLNTDEMQGNSAKNNMNFDFSRIWATTHSYPKLQWQNPGEGTPSKPFRIYDCYDLQAIQNNLSYNYELINDIDCSETSKWNSGKGWSPIGSAGSPFVGKLDGNGRTVEDIYINRTGDGTGLFGLIRYAGHVKDLGLVDVNITGEYYTGALAGRNNGTIVNSYSTGSIDGQDNVGGLVGYNFGTKGSSIDEGIANSYSRTNVSGRNYVGGLSGYNWDGHINSSWSNGVVVGSNDVGGLIGYNREGSFVKDSISYSEVNGTEYVGGLVGTNIANDNWGPKIINGSSSGFVNASQNVGGLVGYNLGRLANISTSHSTSNISSATGKAGGLVGQNIRGSISKSYSEGTVSNYNLGGPGGGLVGQLRNGSIKNSYSLSDVSGYDFSGGLVAQTFGERSNISDSFSAGSVNGGDTGGFVENEVFGSVNISDSYWDNESSGQSSSAGSAIPLETSEMQGLNACSEMNGLDFRDTWRPQSGDYPELEAYTDPDGLTCYPRLLSAPNNIAPKGALWVQGSDLHWGNGTFELWLKDAPLVNSDSSGPDGGLWVQDSALHWIDENGDERKYEGALVQSSVSGTEGALWVQNGYIHYIDQNSNERKTTSN
ncbi:hypothetical protein GLT92_00585 [Nanohaloarchaea archaeon]|jgi:hypothetical protein|nr:hypothetical protein [Candidatus Nanohaloarchaea archaeon]